MKLKDELQRIRDGLVLHDTRLDPPDARSAELLTSGKRREAIHHCKEMYNECLRHGEEARAASYLAFIDQIQFETTVLNLAVNARDAMPAGGAFVIRTVNETIGADRPREMSGGDPSGHTGRRLRAAERIGYRDRHDRGCVRTRTRTVLHN